MSAGRWAPGSVRRFRRVIGLEQGKSLGDLVAALEAGAGFPAWARSMGGRTRRGPKARRPSATVVLAAGRYVLACGSPSPEGGKPQHEHGMIQEFEVPAKVASR